MLNQTYDKKLIAESNRVWVKNTEEISLLIEKSENNNRLAGMNVLMNDHSNQLNSTRVEYVYPTITKNGEPKPIVGADMNEVELAKTFPKKFENGMIGNIYK